MKEQKTNNRTESEIKKKKEKWEDGHNMLDINIAWVCSPGVPVV
jgi:hypothetical protein